uniref:hypothetical protein n=1 Tax=Gordonia sp. B7-2 TaxID=3420932 RepID=UPI003D92D24E
MSSGGVGTFVRGGIAAARPARNKLVSTQGAAGHVAVSVDDLADAVARSERKLLNQLATGDGTVMDLKVSITARQRLSGESGTAAVNLRRLGTSSEAWRHHAAGADPGRIATFFATTYDCGQVQRARTTETCCRGLSL